MCVEPHYLTISPIGHTTSANQHKTQGMEGSSEGKDQASVYNKEFEQSMKRDDDGQASHEDPKDVIVTSNKEDTSVKIVNSNTRMYHEGGQSEKHEIWSHKDLEVKMYLKVLHGVVNVIIQIKPWGERHETKMHDESKCFDQGDDWDKGGACMRPKRLCSGG